MSRRACAAGANAARWPWSCSIWRSACSPGRTCKHWLDALPFGLGKTAIAGRSPAFHLYNPFGMMQCWTDWGVEVAWEKAAWLEAGGAGGGRAVAGPRRLAAAKRTFTSCIISRSPLRAGEARPPVGDRPLSWWAVKRVTRYSGRINLWLAGGFGLLYALYTAAGPHWPAWMGQRVFQIFDHMGGVAGLATGLVVLAAVPAAFQYGLWDSNAHDRCRRLELLLLSRLEAQRLLERGGRGGVEARPRLLRRGTAAVGVGRGRRPDDARGRPSPPRRQACCSGGCISPSASGPSRAATQANGLGVLLTVGLPLAAYALFRLDWPALAALTPPGRRVSRRRRCPGVRRVIRARNGRCPYAGRRPPVAGPLRPRPARLGTPAATGRRSWRESLLAH